MRADSSSPTSLPSNPMMAEREAEIPAPDAKPAAAAERGKILLYAGVMIVALHFLSPSVGLFVIPLSFVLKNKLHFSADGLALFALWASVPGYLSFVFGMVRDFWSPFGMGDRGYFILFGAIASVLIAALAFAGAGEAMLFVSAVTIAICFLFLWAAWNGLASTIGQRRAMSGQMSAMWNFAGTSAIVAAYVLGGALSDRLEGMNADSAVRALFLIVAAQMALIVLLGIWKPTAVFAGHGREPSGRRHPLTDLKRLAKHWPIYPALTIWLLWNFSPGTQTALQYYLSNTLHANDTQWGAWNALSFAAAIPTFVLFGFLSRKFSLTALLWWGALLGVFQMIPLLFVHSATGALIAAIPLGLLGGIATAAFMDLLIRACPKGLEGTMMMLAWSMYALAVSVGNLWGTELYERGGFVACVIVTTIVYALILPAILLVPKGLIATADGEAL